MKKLPYILFVLFFVAGLTSCDDTEFLEESPNTLLTPVNAFDSSKQVDDQVVSAYRAMTDLYTNSWWLGHGADYFDRIDFVSFGDRNSNYGEKTANSYNDQWTALYQIAAYANLALQGAEQVEWNSDEEKEYEVAQAKYFVGWAYLRLGELFGGVPIVSEYSEALKLDYTRSTREETYQFAIDNLEAALAGLPEVPIESGRLSKSAANHTLAEAYLAMGIETDNSGGQWFSNAIAVASDAIDNHPLMEDRFGVRANPSDTSSENGSPTYREDGDVFWDLFRPGNYDAAENTESIWVAKSADFATDNKYSYVDGWMTVHVAPVYQISAAPVFRELYWKDEYNLGSSDSPFGGNIDLTKFPGGNVGIYCGGYSVAQWGVSYYATDKVWGNYEGYDSELWNDMRNSELNLSRQYKVMDQDHPWYGTDNYVTEEMLTYQGDGRVHNLYPMSGKAHMREDLWGYEPSVIATGGTDVFERDMYLMRSAETYLLRAEAYLRNNQPELAASDINALRNRAQCTKTYSASEVDIQLILDERCRELQYEELRWCTLLRIGGDIMKNQLYNNAYYIADIELYTGEIDWELLPIPLDAVINVNTGSEIEQNPGW